jgi:hypothetical protein
MEIEKCRWLSATNRDGWAAIIKKVSAQDGKSVHGLPRSHNSLTGQPALAGVGRGHGEEPIIRNYKIYNSVFSALFGVSVYQKVKSG